MFLILCSWFCFVSSNSLDDDRDDSLSEDNTINESNDQDEKPHEEKMALLLTSRSTTQKEVVVRG